MRILLICIVAVLMFSGCNKDGIDAVGYSYDGGDYPDPGEGFGFSQTQPDPDIEPIPEPATMVLLGSGLLGLGIFKRRKKR